VAGPSTERPELHDGAAGAHKNAFVDRVSTTNTLSDNLDSCKAAINEVSDHEEWLSQTVVGKGSNELLKLEKVLLDLSATPDITYGVYYQLAFVKNR
jgi:hypothetical protein